MSENDKQLEVRYVPIDQLKPNDYNPNRQGEGDFELLCKSIDEDGMTQPIVANLSTMEIVDGEHRWRACKALGFKEVPVCFTTMDAAQARVSTLRHNRARGTEDVELAAAVLKELVSEGYQDEMLDSLSMDAVELDAFLTAIDDPDGFTTLEAEALTGGSDEDLRAAIRAEGGKIGDDETPSVQDAIRAREDRLRGVRADQERDSRERDSRERDTGVYRLRLVFTGQEGADVKRVLGAQPIERLIQLCRERAPV